MKTLMPIERISQKIYLIRGQKAMSDSELADLYEVETFNLNNAVKRNTLRFPRDFMFQLTRTEYLSLTLQIAISKKRLGGRRYLPYVFTERGVAMLSSVLKSRRAIQINITIMRAFVKLREFLATHKQIADKIEKFEKKFFEYDKLLLTIYEMFGQIMDKPKDQPKQKNWL